MNCPRCGHPLLSVLEKSRRVCATCHLFPESLPIPSLGEPARSASALRDHRNPLVSNSDDGASDGSDPAHLAPEDAPSRDGRDTGKTGSNRTGQ
jgi:hypothetical protein